MAQDLYFNTVGYRGSHYDSGKFWNENFGLIRVIIKIPELNVGVLCSIGIINFIVTYVFFVKRGSLTILKRS